jgi:hypothetical protein
MLPETFSGIFTTKYLAENVAWSLLLIILARILEWARGKPFELRRRLIFWTASFIGIFVAISFLTNTIKNPGSPDVRGQFDALVFTILPGTQDGAGLLVMFDVRNVGTPTIVDNYGLTITPPGGSSIQTTLLFIPKVLYVPPAPGTQPLPFPVVCGKDALYRKTGDQPLANGGLARGFLWFQVPGYTSESFKNPTGFKFRMIFKDVLNNDYTADMTWPAVSGPVGVYTPGLAFPRSEKPENNCE